MNRGVAPSIVRPWSLLAPCSTSTSDNFKVPILSCYEKRRCSICLALVFVGTRLKQKSSNNVKKNPSKLQCREALLHHLSRLGLCWHQAPPEIEQLQGAPSQLQCKEALLHYQSCLGLCWHRIQPEIGATSRCPFSAAM